MEKSENKNRPNAGKSYSEYQDDLAQKTNKTAGEILVTIIVIAVIFALVSVVKFG